jgi:hypothetical protein
MKGDLLTKLADLSEETNKNEVIEISIFDTLSPQIYPKSIIKNESHSLFIGKYEGEKFLYVISDDEGGGIFGDLKGELLDLSTENYSVKKCLLDHHNAGIIQNYFPINKE